MMKDYFEHILLTVLLLVAVTATAEPAKTLKIGDFAAVGTGKITLAQMVESTNLESSDEILSIEFGVAPQSGEKITFTNRAISQAISRFMSSIGDDKKRAQYQKLKVSIPNDIVVQGDGWEASLVNVERTL